MAYNKQKYEKNCRKTVNIVHKIYTFKSGQKTRSAQGRMESGHHAAH
jgi:hypothetical protein